jgi:sec-independent protein translocase protein TatC
MAKQNSDEMSMWEHIEALRPHLVRSVCAVFVFFVLAFICKGFIVDGILMGPQSADFPTNRLLNSFVERWGIEGLAVNATTYDFINTSVAGQFNMHMMMAFYVALIVAIPYLLFELWLFVLPALSRRERRYSTLFILYIVVCMALGIAFGYYILSPLSVNFLTGYRVSDNITNMIDVGSYISLVANLVLVCAIIFELPVAVHFLSKTGLLTASFMKRYRRHAIVVLAIGAAIITPPDIMSMILVIIPLYLLYEMSIWIAKE